MVLLKQKKTYRLKKNNLLAQTHKRRQINYKIFYQCIFISVEVTFYKNELIENFIILFAFFCAFEPIDYFFLNR